MTTTYPPSTEADAKNRALRTFAQGLLIDVATVVIALLVTLLSAEVQWTREYWYGVAALVGKTALAAAVSYVARKVVPPQP